MGRILKPEVNSKTGSNQSEKIHTRCGFVFSSKGKENAVDFPDWKSNFVTGSDF